MKILLIHGADIASVNQVYLWEKNKKGLGDFYHLAVFMDYAKLLQTKGQRDLHYLEKQVLHAVKVSRIETVLLLLQENISTMNLLQHLARNFPQISWNIFTVTGKNN